MFEMHGECVDCYDWAFISLSSKDSTGLFDCAGDFAWVCGSAVHELVSDGDSMEDRPVRFTIRCFDGVFECVEAMGKVLQIVNTSKNLHFVLAGCSCYSLCLVTVCAVNADIRMV